MSQLSEFYVIWKIVRQVKKFSARSFQLQPSIMAEIKIGGNTRFENLLKQLFHSPLLDMK